MSEGKRDGSDTISSRRRKIRSKLSSYWGIIIEGRFAATPKLGPRQGLPPVTQKSCQQRLAKWPPRALRQRSPPGGGGGYTCPPLACTFARWSQLRVGPISRDCVGAPRPLRDRARVLIGGGLPALVPDTWKEIWPNGETPAAINRGIVSNRGGGELLLSRYREFSSLKELR